MSTAPAVKMNRLRQGERRSSITAVRSNAVASSPSPPPAANRATRMATMALSVEGLPGADHRVVDQSGDDRLHARRRGDDEHVHFREGEPGALIDALTTTATASRIDGMEKIRL